MARASEEARAALGVIHMDVTICDAIGKVGSKPVKWERIADAVRAQHRIPKHGWMRVRNRLQALMNCGVIARVPATDSYVRNVDIWAK